MLVVSNTSPLSNLAIIGRLELLREQLGAVLIPPAVRAELDRNPSLAARGALEAGVQDGWIRVSQLTSPVREELAASLDQGEAEAISLALQVGASLILLDESAARRQATRLGLGLTGVLGVLRRARETGRIASLKDEIRKLRTDARFFIHPGLEKALLLSVAET